jgi:hypothetical protein
MASDIERLIDELRLAERRRNQASRTSGTYKEAAAEVERLSHEIFRRAKESEGDDPAPRDRREDRTRA